MLAAFRELTTAKQLERSDLLDLLRDGIQAALVRKFGPNVKFELSVDELQGTIKVVRLRQVVETIEDPSWQIALEEARDNFLLGSLNDDELGRIAAKLEKVSLKLGEVLYESGEKMNYIYFPTTAIISMLYIMENGGTAEIGVVGNDGAVGISLFLGGETTTSRAIVQSAGDLLRMKEADLRAEFKKAGRFQELLLRFTQAILTQISQTAVCNRLHSIDQQLCRWLLLSHDRLQSDKLEMTHDLISNMLGVRREGITLAAKKLAARKLIVNKRGTVTVIDRQGLEAASCECYAIVNSEYNRLLGRGMSRTFN